MRGYNRRTHGGSSTKTYKSWNAMMDRVAGRNKNYRGRQFTMDPRWLDFAEFLKDMGERPAGMTLDKNIGNIDNTHYSKETCRWATRDEQNDARNNTLYINVGDKKIPLRQVLKVFHPGTSRPTVYRRVWKDPTFNNLFKEERPCQHQVY